MTNRSGRNRKGFTLIEVVIALVITAMVSTVAASALRAGIDVRERVNRHRSTVDAEARAIEWIDTMLRHSPAATAVNEPLLQIIHRDAEGDSLTFLSNGVEVPAGTGAIWRVSLFADAAGLHVNAVPVRAGGGTPMESVIPHVKVLHADALSAAVRGEWLREWPVLRSMPSAVRLRFGLSDSTQRIPFIFETSPLASGAP